MSVISPVHYIKYTAYNYDVQSQLQLSDVILLPYSTGRTDFSATC